ncbi:DUF2202 domain-containing protein [Candidatus Parcubacteria bacterium]|nr:DUF2202 domain-containing protein [Candidatus Parcubacteria bacterium]
MDKNQLEIIDTMAENESLIGDLYLAYANKFEKEFWESISKDEKMHFSNIINLKNIIDSNKEVFFKERFRIQPVKLLNENIKEAIEKAKEDISLIDALGIAYDFETSMIESNYFDIISTDSESIKNHLKVLEEQTKSHVSKIKQRLEEEKNNNK